MRDEEGRRRAQRRCDLIAGGMTEMAWGSCFEEIGTGHRMSDESDECEGFIDRETREMM